VEAAVEVASEVALAVVVLEVASAVVALEGEWAVVQALTEVAPEAMAVPAVSDLVKTALLAVSVVVEVALVALCPTWAPGRGSTFRRQPISTWDPAVILLAPGEISRA